MSEVVCFGSECSLCSDGAGVRLFVAKGAEMLGWKVLQCCLWESVLC